MHISPTQKILLTICAAGKNYNLPSYAIKNKKELRDKLQKGGLPQEKIELILSYSKLKE
jgi:hypothetical protein